MRPFRRPKLFKKQVISAQDWQKIKDDSEAAKELLEDSRFGFLRDYLHNTQTSIVDHFVQNRIRTVREHIRISDVLTKTLTTTRREQEHELSGQYKFVETMLADLKRIAALADEYLEGRMLRSSRR